MVVRISELDGRSPASGTTFTFSGRDLAEILDQPGADGIGYIGFRQGEYRYEALIGKRGDELMNEPNQLAAKPCPPFCPDSQL